LEEIKEWGLVDDRRRRVILRNAEQRKTASQLHQGSHGDAAIPPKPRDEPA
jgi:predicted Fe-S protein YdhL (DUF1289 family)